MADKEYQRSFGCCPELPEVFRTGSGFSYPQWYIKYLRGEGNKKLTKNVKKLLEYLSDGTWKFHIFVTGIGIGSSESMVELELIQMSPVVRSSTNNFVAELDGGEITDFYDENEIKKFEKDFDSVSGFFGTFKITERGKIALSQNSLP